MTFDAGVGVTLIVLGIILGFTLGGVGILGEGATFRERVLSSGAIRPLIIIHYFLPYSLAVLVIFMDIMSQLPQGVFSLPIALGLMLLNKFVSGRVDTPDLPPSDLCEIPGLKSLSSKFMPQSLLFVTTVVTYLAAFVTSSQNIYATTTVGKSAISPASVSMSPSPSSRTTAAWVLAGSVIFFQFIGLASSPECMINAGIPVFGQVNRGVSMALSVVLGGLVGGISGWQLAGLTSLTQPTYTVQQSLGPGGTQKGQKASLVREQFQLGSGLGELPVDTTAQEDSTPQLAVDVAKTSEASSGESSDQFVCEAYKNGQLVTTTLVG